MAVGGRVCANLEANLTDLLERIMSGRYKRREDA